MWAQELIILLNELHPEDGLVKLYASSVFSSAGNHQGLQIINSEYQDINVFEKIFEQFRNDYLTIPAAPEMKFSVLKKKHMIIWQIHVLVILVQHQWESLL